MKQLILILAALVCGEAQGADVWSWNAAAQTTVVRNSGSQLRAGAAEMGVVFSADYLEVRGVTLGYTRTAVQFLQALPQVKQQAVYVSLREHFYADSSAGRFTLRVDGHRSVNDDAGGFTDAVSAGAMQAAYTDNERQVYLDLGNARSRYADLLDVRQLTPTLGLALQQGAAWLQLRGYVIAFSDPALAQGFERTRAVELKYSYWPMPGSRFKPHRFQLGALGGKRLFAVDMDAAAVSNLADPQTGGVALGADWKMGKNTTLLLLAGQNRYENVSLSNRYRGNFMYVNLNAGW